jgi:hypothetical protein
MCLELPVHMYFSILWENRYKKSYAMICDLFLAKLYFIIFHQECPRISKQAKKIISLINNWYLEEKCTYFMIFGATRAPHLLPAYVPDRLALGEICYQTILQGFNASLVKDKKRVFIPYNFNWVITLSKIPHKKTRRSEPFGIQVQDWRYPKHDPKGLVLKHSEQVTIYWPYAHDKFDDEVFTENAHSWDEVIQENPSLPYCL